jgi:dihydrofolate synthase / folylpolyglutamate synthase
MLRWCGQYGIVFAASGTGCGCLLPSLFSFTRQGVMFSTYADVLAHLDKVGLFHMDFGLHRMQAALQALGLMRPPFAVVQVLGTNGKGSTSTFLASMAQEQGCSTGLYTSPHFVFPAERIRINGVMLAEERWAALGNAIMEVRPDVTYFEFMTLLALLAFRESKVRVAVIEAGLGGAHDATTAFAADVLCYAPIGMDHTAILGNSLHAIASDKAGAIRSAAPVCSAAQEPEALAVLKAACAAHHAPLCLAPALPRGTVLGLAGEHQRGNAALAVAGWNALAAACALPNRAEARAEGLKKAFFAGRLQQTKAFCSLPALWLDGAHNEHGMRALALAIEQAACPPVALIFSCLKDKDWQAMSALLLHAVGKNCPIVVPSLHNERAAEADALVQHLHSLGAQQVCAVDDISLAFPLLEGEVPFGSRPVLICGSLYLLSEFYRLFPQYLERSRALCPRPTEEKV